MSASVRREERSQLMNDLGNIPGKDDGLSAHARMRSDSCEVRRLAAVGGAGGEPSGSTREARCDQQSCKQYAAHDDAFEDGSRSSGERDRLMIGPARRRNHPGRRVAGWRQRATSVNDSDRARRSGFPRGTIGR